MTDGLRRRDFRVKNLDVSGQITGAGAGGSVMVSGSGQTWYVDASKATGVSGDGTTWDEAFITIAEGIAAASAGDVCYVAAQTHTDYTGDPVSYEENLTIPYALSNFALIGVSRGRTQGGLPQLKDGSTTTQHILRIRAPGCLIANLGFNGSGNTGGGILFDDDYAAKAAFGTTIANCHFKNCKATTKTAATGGAINWSSAGNAWQILITGCKFYKNEVDICLKGTSNTVPQDVTIEDCIFSGPAASVNCNLFLKGGGSGINGVIINNCIFPELPALSSGDTNRYGDLTGCVGMMTNCRFGSLTANTGTTITFKADGTGMKIPDTVFMAANFGKTETAGESGEINNA